MAHKLTVGISVNFLSDGSSDTLVLDLLSDPYRLDPPEEVNWPPSSRKAPLPTAVDVGSLNWGIPGGGGTPATGSATISGSVITFTFTGAPPAGLQSFPAHLIF